MSAPGGTGHVLASRLDIGVSDFEPPGPARGRSVYLQGQLHANESAAMLVLQDLVRRMRSTTSANRVRVVPNANPLGWSRYLASGPGRISADGRNWNRLFVDPRSSDGSADDVLAHTLWELSAPYDVIIDVHTPEFGWGHLYASDPDRRLATMDDIPHVFYGAPSSGPFDECHLRLRNDGPAPVRASVTLEVPSHEIPDAEFVSEWSARLLREIEAQSESAAGDGFPRLYGTINDLIPEISGAVVLRCTPGEPLEMGAPILSVHDRNGKAETITAPSDCIPVCFRRATVVQAGYWVCRVISLH